MSEPPEMDHRTHTLKIIAAWTIIVSGLITIAAYGFPQLGGIFSGDTSGLAVAAGPAPGSALYVVNEKNDSLDPITVTVDGRELHALDAQAGPDGSWYFILNEMSEQPITNLYIQKEDGSVTRLTTSSTAKYNLSYDAQSGKLTYQASTDTDTLDFLTSPEWDLTVFDPAVGEETVVAVGTDPVLLPGGSAFLFKSGEELVLGAVGSDATSTVLSIPSGLYAVDAASGAAAVYNEVTQQIDLYDLTNGASPSYRESVDVDLMPSALAYVDGKLLAAYAVQRDDVTIFTFSRPDSGGTNPVTITDVPNGNPQRIYAYK